jgi:hypothetical protein
VDEHGLQKEVKMKKLLVILTIIGCAGVSLYAQTAGKVVYKEIPFSELKSAISSVNKAGQGFVVDAYLSTTNNHCSWHSLTGIPDPWDYGSNQRTKNNVPFVEVGGHGTDGVSIYGDDPYYFTYSQPIQFEIYQDLGRRIDIQKKYKIYIGVYYRIGGIDRRWEPKLDKIEGLMSIEEADAREAQQKAEREAAEAAKKKAEAAALEVKQNPSNINRALYKGIKVEDFSFDMVAGNIKVGTKVAFRAKFFTKPTGTEYRFQDLNLAITLSSNHNFVRDMPATCFGGVQSQFWGYQSQQYVVIYVTVKKAGKYGEATVDIVEW